MVTTIDPTTQRHLSHIILAQYLYHKLPITYQVINLIGHNIQEQDVVAVIELVIDIKVDRVEIEEVV